jgi:DNA-binding GntR family transcriptional regulator
MPCGRHHDAGIIDKTIQDEIMGPLARSSLSDQIFSMISNRIIRSEYQPGETIYETQISKDLGVSRSPVRDALHMLEQIRLVDRTPKGSYQVTGLSVDFINNFYEAVNIVYRYAFAKTAERATPEELSRLSDAMKKTEESLDKKDYNMYLAGISEIANVVLSITRNPIIERIALELMPNAERIQWASITFQADQMKNVVSHIRRGYEHILKRNADLAANSFSEFAYAHKEVAIKSIMQLNRQNAMNQE